MKQKIYILLTAVLAALAGCIHDTQWDTPGPADADDGSVSLNIAVPAPVAKNMGRTRGVGDFDRFENINVMIAEGTDIIYSLYITFDASGNATTTPPAGIVYGKRADDYDDSQGDGNDEDGSNENNYGAHYGIHFSQGWFENYGISSETVDFYIVGNYGAAIDMDTVGELQSLKYNSSLPGSGSPGNNVMYGKSEDYDGDKHSHNTAVDPHQGGRTLKVELKRLAAMITVKIDGSGLSDYVEITPLKISLHNVPSWSYVAKPNNIYAEAANGDWIDDGEWIDVGAQVGGTLGTFASGESPMGHPVSTTFGWHYTDAGIGGSEANPNFAYGGSTNVPALFMLENIHGDNFGDADVDDKGYGKRPAGVANNKVAIWAASETNHCSYLEVEAEYLEYNGSGSSNVVRGGTITYRVFLGEDVARSFDVKRNSYYRYTLMLSGTGVGENDASWRMDKKLSTSSLLDESEFILNGAGEMIVINELIAAPNQSWYSIYYNGPSQGDVNDDVTYLYLVGSSGGSGSNHSWGALPLESGTGINPERINTETNDGHIQFRLFVDPMTTDDGDGYMRRVEFYLGTQAGYQTAPISITQYAPMVIEVNPANVSDEIRVQIAAAGINPEQPFTIHFDRVDRSAMPWGFDGGTITANAGSGYANEAWWLNTAAAAGYLPFGDGSAMMHAAFLNYYQWSPRDNSFANTLLGTPVTIFTMREYHETNPTVPIVPNSIPSSAEWKLLEMLDQAGFNVFDKVHEHDIIPWQPYWTSDAVASGTTQSVAYRRNAAGSFVNVDRTSPMPYRMIYIEQ